MQPQNVTDINCPDTANQIFYWITCSFGILINMTLCVIICYKTPGPLQPYSLVLKISCLIDIYSSFTQVITMAVGFDCNPLAYFFRDRT